MLYLIFSSIRFIVPFLEEKKKNTLVGDNYILHSMTASVFAAYKDQYKVKHTKDIIKTRVIGYPIGMSMQIISRLIFNLVFIFFLLYSAGFIIYMGHIYIHSNNYGNSSSSLLDIFSENTVKVNSDMNLLGKIYTLLFDLHTKYRLFFLDTNPALEVPVIPEIANSQLDIEFLNRIKLFCHTSVSQISAASASCLKYCFTSTIYIHK